MLPCCTRRWCLLLVLVAGVGGCGGGGGGPTGPSQPATPPPPIALPDPIAYDALGSGRLCFERLVWGNNGLGSGTFVIDASARRSWGIQSTKEPAISPDGLRIAYSAVPDGGASWQVYTIPAEGGFPVWAGGGPGLFHTVPAWTPSSQLIWHSDSDGGSFGGIFETRDSVSVAGLRAVGESFGGSSVISVYQSYPGHFVLARVNADPHTALAAPAFSPDGNELAWIRVWEWNEVAARMDVVVGGPDGSHAETIVTLPLPGGVMHWSGGNNLSLAWSPDGRRLAFNRPESSTTGHVFVVSRNGGPPTQITSAPGVGDRSVSWSYLPRP